MTVETVEYSHAVDKLLPETGSVPWRRLYGAATAVGVLALAGELVGSRIGRERNQTEIGGELGDHIAFGGLGMPWSNDIARVITAATGTPIRDVRYASSDLTIEGMGAALGDHYGELVASGIPRNGIRTNIVGISLGALMFLNAATVHAKECRRLGLPVHPVDTMIAIGSPFKDEDTHMERMVNIIARSKYTGGPATQFVSEFFSAMRDRGYSLSNVPGAAKWAATSYGRGDPSPMWTRKVQILAAKKIFIDGALEGVLTAETEIYHVGNESTDKTTRISQARTTLRALAAKYDSKVFDIDTPGLEHADVEGSMSHIARIIKETARRRRTAAVA